VPRHGFPPGMKILLEGVCPMMKIFIDGKFVSREEVR
jgi:hypothetical protein